MVVPEDPVCISFEDGQNEAELQIKQLCARILPGWGDVKVADMQVSRISGGISNLLVKVEPPPPRHPVAVKVFGDKTELLIDREAEKHTLLRLNELGFGAQVIGLFGNGRIEEFLVAHTLTPGQVADPRFVAHIASRMRAFHDLDMTEAAAKAAAASAAAATAAAAEGGAGDGAAVTTVPTCATTSSDSSSQWDPLYGWLEMARGLSFPHDAAKQAAYDKVDFGAVRAELDALRAVCDRVASPRVFCHNDLLPGNILIIRPRAAAPAAAAVTAEPQEQAEGKAAEQHADADGRGDGEAAAPQAKRQRVEAQAEDADGQAAATNQEGKEGEQEDVLEGGTLQFIDFEYSGYGCRGFDFGNHFNEYAGFDCDYTRFPSPEQQKVFFRQYLKPGELRRLAEERLAAAAAATGGSDGAAAAAEPADAAALAAAEDAVLERMVAEACVFALLSHAAWGVWSYIQARYSPIEFDYLEYSQMRWAEYHRRKAEFFALAERVFPQ